MINPYSLLAMMQYGGTAGGATLARALQRRSDADTLEEYQKAEAERQKRGRLFGSAGGLGLGLLGAALAPATGGLSLALASGAGTALGKGIGERVGAGKAEGYDRSGTVYGQRAFKDVAEASKEYNRGIAGRAGMAGLKAGLTAGLAPGGGMYGKVGGKLGTAQARTAFLEGLPLRAESLSTGISNMFTGAPTPSMPVAPSVNRLPSDMISPLSTNAKIFDPSTVFQQSSYDPFSVLSGPRLPGGSYTSMSGVQDGGLIGMQYGGYGGTVEDILENAGLDATPQQLALFEQFDPTQLQNVAKGLQQSLLSGTQQGQQHQAKAGFGGMGAIKYGQAQQRKAAGEQFTSAKAEAARAFESQTLGTAADLIAGGAEFGETSSTGDVGGGLPAGTLSDLPEFTVVTSLPTDNQGLVHMNGDFYVWSEESGQYELQG